MVPFFPDWAEKNLRANSTVVGVIFALYPLSLFLTSLVAGMASARFGRVLVYVIGALCTCGGPKAKDSVGPLTTTRSIVYTQCAGLVLLGGGTVGFGFCDTLASIMVMRVVQGVGGGCINVAGMALLLQVNPHLHTYTPTPPHNAQHTVPSPPPHPTGLQQHRARRWPGPGRHRARLHRT